MTVRGIPAADGLVLYCDQCGAGWRHKPPKRGNVATVSHTCKPADVARRRRLDAPPIGCMISSPRLDRPKAPVPIRGLAALIMPAERK